MASYTAQDRVADRLRLPTLNAQIEQLENVLAALRAEREVVQDRLDAYTYPVLSLPNEIICEMFMQFIPVYPMRCRPLGEDSPAHLGQICKHWRDISLCTPALWRALDLRRERPPHSDACIAMTRCWLERSCSLPMSIAYSGDNGALFSALAEYSRRWEYASLELSLDGRLQLPTTLPILLELAIEFDENGLATPQQHIMAPSLSKVQLHLIFDAPMENLLPWDQLVALRLVDVYVPVVVSILRETRCLRQFRMDIAYDEGERTTHVDPLPLPLLDTLVVEFGHPYEDLHALLGALQVPNLKHFAIHGDVFGDEPVAHQATLFSGLVAGFGCSLERLCISGPCDDPAGYRTVFAQITSVELPLSYKLNDREWGNWESS